MSTANNKMSHGGGEVAAVAINDQKRELLFSPKPCQPAFICLLVCSSVAKITQNDMNGYGHR